MSEKKEVQTVDAEVIGKGAQIFTPMDLIAKGMDQGTAIEDMAKLFDLQLRYEENEAKKSFHAAVSAFKNEAITILKDKHVEFATSKGKTEYDHARLGSICKVVIPSLSKHELSHRWSFVQDGAKVAVTCVLSHRLGHTETVTLEAGKDESGGKNSIQALASSISYLERYTFLAITGLAAEDQDDDGRSAEEPAIEYITENQVMDLESMMAEVKADAKGFQVYFKVDDIAKLPAVKFSQAIKMLENKRKGGA